MTDWQPTSLANVVTLQRGHDLPTTQRGTGSVPVIGSFGITGYHDEAKYSGPGVAIGRSGASIGVATYCPEDYWPLNTCLFVKDYQGNDPRWVYYLLDSIDFSAYNSGSAQPSLNRNYLAKISVQLPPVEEQRGIAETLGALDDRIESSRTINKRLEQLAQAHFRSWFVEFQPWGGDAPSDWRIGRLSDVLSLAKQSIKAGSRTDLPYVPIDMLPMNSLGIEDFRPNDDAKSSLIIFEKDDILIGAMRVYFHRVCIAPFDGITRSTSFVLRPRDPAFLAWALLLCNEDETIEFANSTSKGSTMPYAVWEGGLANMPTLVPTLEVAREFSELVTPIVRRLRDSVFELRKLRELRSTLLSDLMTGRVRVPESGEVIA